MGSTLYAVDILSRQTEILPIQEVDLQGQSGFQLSRSIHIIMTAVAYSGIWILNPSHVHPSWDKTSWLLYRVTCLCSDPVYINVSLLRQVGTFFADLYIKSDTGIGIKVDSLLKLDTGVFSRENNLVNRHRSFTCSCSGHKHCLS